ncbi:Tim44 domain-containing protein [Caulobacter sp. KR2-114]|uniref:Tim44 domain-containing protein n=1 Tax=Caulobacter sp. KR2-114 TaxID=3400912 RepID=UPI003C00A75A
MTRSYKRWAAALGLALVLGGLMADPADARRGGSFGSRGARTYSAPRSSYMSPSAPGPVQRSMTSPSQYPGAPSYAPSYSPGFNNGYRRPGFWGGFGGGFLGGLIGGGLIGGLMGHGWGGGWGGAGGGGGLTILIQLLILGGIAWFAFSLFRRRGPAFAGGSGWSNQQPPMTQQMFGGQAFGGFGAPQPAAGGGPALEIPITQMDRDAFERLLLEIQDAFGHEDYGRLRDRTTPEVMSFLAEELSQNATHNRRNDVTAVRLVQADVTEAWREGPVDYATAALRYQSIDVMRDRGTGAVIEGDPNRPTETVEFWTFARENGGAWKLSAIQET